MHDLVIKNGLVVTPSGLLRGGLAVEGEVIVRVCADAELGKAKRVIDAQEKIIFPGMFDPHFHLGNGDDVGIEAMRGDFRLESREMLVAGVTTFATTTLYGSGSIVKGFKETLYCGKENTLADYKITCCVSTEEQVFEMAEVAKLGCVDFKFFTGYKGEQAEMLSMTREGITLRTWRLACEQLAAIGAPAFPKIHAEEPFLRELMLERIRTENREDYLVAWAEHTPGIAENLQIYNYAMVADSLKVPVYIVHVSCKETIPLLRYLTGQNVRLIGETTPAFLCGDAREMQSRDLKARAKIQPPIRFAEDNQALWQAVSDGTLSIIGTDSLPYSTKYKDSVGFWESRVGLNCQVPATIPLMITEGLHKGWVDWPRLAAILSSNPAKVYGIYPQKGALRPGSDADIVIIDPDREHVLSGKACRGKTDYSIWEGRKVKGLPVLTVLRGQVVAEEGEVVNDTPRGRHVLGVKPAGL